MLWYPVRKEKRAALWVAVVSHAVEKSFNPNYLSSPPQAYRAVLISLQAFMCFVILLKDTLSFSFFINFLPLPIICFSSFICLYFYFFNSFSLLPLSFLFRHWICLSVSHSDSLSLVYISSRPLLTPTSLPWCHIHPCVCAASSLLLLLGGYWSFLDEVMC